MSENKKSSDGGIKQMSKLGIILAIFAVVACLLLAIVSQCTAGRIAANAREKTNAAMKVVFPTADTFEEIDPSNYSQSNGKIKILNMYLAKKAGEVVGIVTRASGPTYENTTLLVAQDLNKNVTGVQILETSDSPGFGQKAADPNYTISTGQTFTEQFAGKNSANGFTAGENFEGISGASITSKGIGGILSAATSAANEYLANNNIAGDADGIPESALRELFPGATSFERASGFKSSGDDTINIEDMYLVYINGKLAGAVTRVSGNTYQNSTLLVAQDTNNTLTGVKILSTTDTPGIGGKIADESYKVSDGKTFAGQFAGKSTVNGFKPGVNFDGVTGATITSDRIGKILTAATSSASDYLAKVGSPSSNAGAKQPAAAAAPTSSARHGPGFDAVFDYDGALVDLADISGFAAATFSDETGKEAGAKIRYVFTVERLYTISSGGKVVAACAALRGPTYNGEGVVLTTVNADRKIIGVRIIELPDAAEYAAPNLASEFYRQFEDLDVDGNILQGQKYDAISGASITSDCIADIIKVGASRASMLMTKYGGKREPADLPSFTINNHRNK